jgi:hypothetical protein
MEEMPGFRGQQDDQTAAASATVDSLPGKRGSTALSPCLLPLLKIAAKLYVLHRPAFYHRGQISDASAEPAAHSPIDEAARSGILVRSSSLVVVVVVVVVKPNTGGENACSKTRIPYKVCAHS